MEASARAVGPGRYELPFAGGRREPAACGQDADVDQVRDLGAGCAPAVAGPVEEQFVLARKRMEPDALLADPTPRLGTEGRAGNRALGTPATLEFTGAADLAGRRQ